LHIPPCSGSGYTTFSDIDRARERGERRERARAREREKTCSIRQRFGVGVGKPEEVIKINSRNSRNNK
jgi:hypothetical protein